MIYNRTASPPSSAPSRPHPPASPLANHAAEAGELELGPAAVELGIKSEAVVGLPAMTELTLSMFLLVTPALRLTLLMDWPGGGAEVMRVVVRVLLLEMIVVVMVVDVREAVAGEVTEGAVVGMEVALAGDTFGVSCCSTEGREGQLGVSMRSVTK